MYLQCIIKCLYFLSVGSSDDLFKDTGSQSAAAATAPPREVVFHTLEPLARLDKKPDRCEISSEDLVRVCRRAEDLRDNKFPFSLFSTLTMK